MKLFHQNIESMISHSPISMSGGKGKKYHTRKNNYFIVFNIHKNRMNDIKCSINQPFCETNIHKSIIKDLIHNERRYNVIAKGTVIVAK
jgi:hypothetical protein